MDLRREERTSEIEQEIRHHLQECAEHLAERGMDPKDAKAEAARRFGDVEAVRRELDQIRRKGRLRRILRMAFGSVWSDLRFTGRSYRRRPGFVIAVTLTLALGIGAATSIFSVLDAVLFRPLAYKDLDRWVEVYSGTPDRSRLSHDRVHFQGWEEAGASFLDAWVGFRWQSLVRIDGPQPESLRVTGVTPGTIGRLGIPLLMGRGFLPTDGRPGGTEVVIVTRPYWERMGSDPGIVGQTIHLETGLATVVGVLRGDVKFPDYGSPAELWMPIREDFTVGGRELRSVQGVWARLSPGVTIEQAQARADWASSLLQAETPVRSGWSIVLRPVGRHRTSGALRQALWVLAATVGLLLLIAAINAVNLILVRTTTRIREFSVRRSLGCSRTRLTRQLLVEGTVLGLGGAIGAVGLARLGVQNIGPILPSSLIWSSPHLIQVEGRTLAFSFAMALLVGAVLGLVPSLAGSRMKVLNSDRNEGETPRQRRVRRVLVVGQIAISLTLLATGGLLARSVTNLLAVDSGYDVGRVATMEFHLPASRYPSPPERLDFVRRIETRLEALPGVAGVAISNGSGFMASEVLQTEGGYTPEVQPRLIPHTSVGPDFIETLGLELLVGRGFDRTELAQASDVAIVDQDLANFLWADAAPVGRRFRAGDGRWLEVVGVVRELRMMGRDQSDGPYQILLPISEKDPDPSFDLKIRTTSDPSLVLPELRAQVTELDPWLSIHLRTAASALAEWEAEPRFLLLLTTLLATTAVALATVGLYGILAYTVRTREKELGVRIALGADRAGVMGLVFRDGLTMTTVGIAAGLGGALLASRLVESLLFEVGPRDPVALGSSVVLFLAIASAASSIPAFRATAIPPASTLRRD